MQIFTFFLVSSRCTPRESPINFSDDTIDDGDYDDDTSISDDEEISTQTEAVVYEKVGNVHRISVRAANDDSLGCSTLCLHGQGRTSCTMCNRPSGRCGRAFKRKQDDDKRERQRKKGVGAKKVTFG